MADAKIIIYGQQIGGGSVTLPSNVDSAMALKDPEGHTYVQVDTDTDERKVIISAEDNSDGTTGADWVFDNSGRFSPSASGTVCLNTEDPSATNPNILPHRNDPDTGIGRASGDRLSLIAGGTEALRLGGGGVIGKLATSLNGTFTATNGSAEITSGSSTAFRTELNVGSAIELFEDSTSRGVFTVTAIASDTALTLDSTVSGLSSSPKAGMTGKTDGGELFAVKTGDSKSILAVTGEGGLVLNSSAADSGIYNNLAIGDSDILSKITTANRNYIIGHSNGDWDITSADSCTIMGYNTGVQVTTGSNNTLIGAYAGDGITTQTAITCLGTGTGRSTGSYSTYIGGNAGAAVSSNGNTAVGYDAMTVSGPQYGVAMGQQAHKSCTGTRNVAIGVNALMASGSASSCVAIGYEAAKIATGGGNVCIGYNSGDAITSGVQNTSLGNDTDCSATNNNQLALGYGAVTDGANKIRLGNSSIGTANIQVDWTIDSDERIKENIQDADAGLDFINALRPVSFTRKHPAEWPEEIRDRRYKQGKKESDFITDEDGNITGEVESYVSTETYDVDTQEPIKDEFDSTSRVDGLIAQEVKSVVESLGVGFHGIDEAANGKLGIQYSTLVVPLIKAVQELTARIEQLEGGD